MSAVAANAPQRGKPADGTPKVPPRQRTVRATKLHFRSHASRWCEEVATAVGSSTVVAEEPCDREGEGRWHGRRTAGRRIQEFYETRGTGVTEKQAAEGADRAKKTMEAKRQTKEKAEQDKLREQARHVLERRALARKKREAHEAKLRSGFMATADDDIQAIEDEDVLLEIRAAQESRYGDGSDPEEDAVDVENEENQETEAESLRLAAKPWSPEPPPRPLPFGQKRRQDKTSASLIHSVLGERATKLRDAEIQRDDNILKRLVGRPIGGAGTSGTAYQAISDDMVLQVVLDGPGLADWPMRCLMEQPMEGARSSDDDYALRLLVGPGIVPQIALDDAAVGSIIRSQQAHGLSSYPAGSLLPGARQPTQAEQDDAVARLLMERQRWQAQSQVAQDTVAVQQIMGSRAMLDDRPVQVLPARSDTDAIQSLMGNTTPHDGFRPEVSAASAARADAEVMRRIMGQTDEDTMRALMDTDAHRREPPALAGSMRQVQAAIQEQQELRDAEQLRRFLG